MTYSLVHLFVFDTYTLGLFFLTFLFLVSGFKTLKEHYNTSSLLVTVVLFFKLIWKSFYLSCIQNLNKTTHTFVIIYIPFSSFDLHTVNNYLWSSLVPVCSFISRLFFTLRKKSSGYT